jgi:hypothetical protein
MSFKVGDKVRAKRNTSTFYKKGDIFEITEVGISYISFININNFKIHALPTDFELVSKFQVGDRAKIIKSTGWSDFPIGTEVEVIIVFNNYIMVERSDGVNMRAYEDQLELLPPSNNTSPGTQIYNTTNGYTIGSGTFTVPKGFTVSFDHGIEVKNERPHSCTFRTYTGLTYKEEFCDCGITKNRRGLYDAN